MRWAEGFIAVDWGTTNRRAYLIGADGSLRDEMEDERGILSVDKGGFEEAVREIRTRLGELPLLMAGMVGSNRGWVEAPYVPCPAGIALLAESLYWVEPDRIAIVPGVSYVEGEGADVMRGEEVQVVGAVATGMVPRSAAICHPGTHNKWVVVEDGRIKRFRTVMTGELFNLLKENSILADLLGEPAELGKAFESGVAHGLTQTDLTAELFSVRARVLLGHAPRSDAGSYTSGLLIGADLRVGLEMAGAGEIAVMGRPELTRLFGWALEMSGRKVREIDGEEAFLAGVKQLAELI